MLIRNCVGAGSLAPKLAKISPNTGTTFTSRKIVIRIATTRDDRGIHHRRFDLLAQAGGVFQISGQTGENFSEQTAFFTGGHHADVKPAENLGMLLQRLGETVAAFDAGADVFDDVAHDFVGGLFGQSLERLHHGQTGVDHRGQLAGENDEVREGDVAAGGLAFLADLFLDGDDQQVAVQQRGDGCLLGGGFDRAADFPAGGRFPRYIDERRHRQIIFLSVNRRICKPSSRVDVVRALLG